MATFDVRNLRRADLARELIRRKGLHGFVESLWSEVEGTTPFKNNWHIQGICEHLEAVSRREIRNLCITVPPGFTKTRLTNVFWPAWDWSELARKGYGNYTGSQSKWMNLSWDQALVLREAAKLRDLITSEIYHELFPAFVPQCKGRDALHYFVNGHGGSRKSASVGVNITGWHADTQVADDLNNPKHAAATSGDIMQKTRDFYTGTASNRRTDPLTFCRVVIGQRIHENDVPGMCLREYGFEHFCVPFRYEPKCFWDIGSSLGGAKRYDPRTTAGELAWKSRYDEITAIEAEKSIGSPGQVQAQNQQNPTPDTGGIIEKGWFRYYVNTAAQLAGAQMKGCIVLPTSRPLQIVQSWDLGFDGEEGHSRVAAAVWARYDVGYFQLARNAKWRNYPESKKYFKAVQQTEPWKRAIKKLIERKANGPALIAELKGLPEGNGIACGTDGKLGIAPVDSKEMRLTVHSDKFETGQVFILDPSVDPTITDYVQEMVSFPKGSADDEVDVTTQALDALSDAYGRYLNALRNMGPAR